MSHLLCFGLGYSAEALARRVAGAGWTVSGTAESPEAVRRASACSDTGWLFDGTTPMRRAAAALADATHLLVSTPPGDHGDPVLRWHGDLCRQRHTCNGSAISRPSASMATMPAAGWTRRRRAAPI